MGAFVQEDPANSSAPKNWGYLSYSPASGWAMPVYETTARIQPNTTLLFRELTLAPDSTIWYSGFFQQDSALWHLANHQWEYEHLPTSLQTSGPGGIYRLISTRNGQIAACMATADFHLVEGDKVVRHTLPAAYQTNNSRVMQLAAGKNDTLWMAVIGDNNAILGYHIPTDTWTVAPQPPGLPSELAYMTLKTDQEGNLWANAGYGLFKKNSSQWVDYLPSTGLTNPYATDVAFSAGDTTWALLFDGTATTLATLHNAQWTFLPNTPVSNAAGTGTYSISVDRLNNIWFTSRSYDGTWIRYDGSNWLTINASTLGVFIQYGELVQNNNNVYWILSQKGLYKLDSNFYATEDMTWAGKTIHQLAFNSLGNTWLTSSNPGPYGSYTEHFGLWQYNENGIATSVAAPVATVALLTAAPNPTTGGINFHCNALLPGDLVVLSLTGAEVMRIPATAWQSGWLQTDLRPLADGLYVARCGQSHTLIEKVGGQ